MKDLQWILDALPVGVWVGIVPAGDAAYSNAEFERILGIHAVPGSDIEAAPRVYGICDRAGRPYPVEGLPFSRAITEGRPVVVDDLVIHRPDGRKVDVRAFGYPTRDEAGTITHVIIAFIDITREVAAERERAEAAARLELVLEHAPIAIWASDADGRITLSRGAGIRRLGVTGFEGQNMFEVFAENPTIPAILREALAGAEVRRSVEMGGTYFDTWAAPTRGPSGEVVGVVGVSSDITEVRRLEALAIQNDRAIALGIMAAGVAHEINNPLTYVIGNLERIEAALTGPAPIDAAAARALLAPVKSGVERIRTVTQSLATFVRARPDEPPGPVEVAHVVEDVLAMVKKELDARATVSVELAPVSVVGHASRLAQVVLNLLVNAMHAVESAHQPWIGISTATDGDHVVLRVEDNGPGVSPELRDQIFEPFVTTKSRGLGLGLFISRSLVREMGGELSALERSGGGACFAVRLLGRASGARPAPSPSPSRGRGKILVIDDEPLVAKVLCAQLEHVGYEALPESEGDRALARLLDPALDFDLVYCDLMMKDVSGMEIAAILGERAPAVLARVVFMTGGVFTPDAQAFVRRHPGEVIEKPFRVLEETDRRLRARSG